MSTNGSPIGTSSEQQVLCPSCSHKGRSVKPITIESLVKEDARTRADRTEGFRFCAEPTCDVAYYHLETGHLFRRTDVKVRIGQKETTSPRPVCYCFGHTVEEIEEEVRKTGSSRLPDDITQKCRQGLEHCEETNPQGSCCLGNVRQVLKTAQAQYETGKPEGHDSRMDAGTLAQFGALVSAVLASACCWQPLLLLAVGVSGGALSATFEAWRPVLLPITFLLLGLAFYSTYRRPKAAPVSASELDAAGDACCAPGADVKATACCLPPGTKGFMLRKFNKVMLWVVTAFVLAFAFFPNYAGYLLGGGVTLAARHDLDKVVVKIEGMNCEACAAKIENALRNVTGVAAAEVNYEKAEAVVGVPRGHQVPRVAILAAIGGAGNYAGRFGNQVQWTFAIEGMTCQGCAAQLQSSLANLAGVSSASANYEQRRAVVVADPLVSEEKLRKAVSDAGYSLASVTKQ